MFTEPDFVVGTLHMFNHLILTTTLVGKDCFNTIEKSEVQRDQ